MRRAFLLLILLLCPAALAQERHFQTGHTHDILNVEFSPDDSQLISYSAADGRLCLWDVKTAHLLWMTKTEFIQKSDEYYNLKEFSWSKDGTRLITASENGTFQTWELSTGRILTTSDTRPALELLKTQRRELSITRDYSEVTVVDPATKQRKVFKSFGFNQTFNTSNDGTMIAEGGGWGDASIRITEISSGRSWWLDGHPSVVKAMTFSPDGHSLAVAGSDKNIYIFDAANRRLERILSGHTKPVTSLAFSPDGKLLISGEQHERLKAWQLPSGKILRDISFGDGIHGVANLTFSSDGRRFLALSAGSLKVWDANTLRLFRSIATEEGYESTSGNMTIGYSSVPISSAMFLGTGARIMTAHIDGSLRTWDVSSGKQLKVLKSGEELSLVRLSHDEKTVIAATGRGEDIQIRVFDTERGKVTRSFEKTESAYLEALVVSNDGKHFATSDVSGDILIWDLDNDKPVRKLDIGFSGDDALAFSPDGKSLAAGGRNQNLFVFEVASGKNLWQLIPDYQESKLEKRLIAEKEARLETLKAADYERDKQAAIETEKYKDQVYITFAHYGDMTNPGELRMMESSAPKLSTVKKPAAEATAIWLRLHNDSPLPVRIPTQSMYLPQPKCFHQFPSGLKLNGLCDGSEVAIWFGLEDKNGNSVPFGFDFGSAAVLLPKASVLFAVPRDLLEDGRAIRFKFTFQNEGGRTGTGVLSPLDYGTPKPVRFRQADLPGAN